MATGKLRLNVTSVTAETPLFRIPVGELLPATLFYLAAYAVNAKGRSDVALLEDIMLGDSEKHTGKVSVALDIRPPLTVVPLGCQLSILRSQWRATFF